MFRKALQLTARLTAAAGLVGAAAGTAIVGLATPASAAVPGHQIVQATSAFDSGNFKSVVATCPAGKRVTGTGFHLLGAQGDIVVDDLIPSASSVRVSATEDQDGTTANWKVTALAVCADPLPGLEIVTATSRFGQSALSGASAVCPSNKRVVGTGADLINGAGQISLSNVMLRQDAVHAYGTDDQDGYTGSWAVTAYAVCANPLPGLEYRTASSASDSTTQRLANAECPGKRALGLGWVMGGSGQALLTFAGLGQSGATLVANEDDDGYLESWSVGITVACASA